MATPTASNSPASGPARLTTTQWLIVVLASIGFAFDIYELLMAQFVLPPAIPELTVSSRERRVSNLGGPVVLHSRLCRRHFWLVGWVSDRPVRPPQVLTWSILLYAVSAF